MGLLTPLAVPDRRDLLDAEAPPAGGVAGQEPARVTRGRVTVLDIAGLPGIYLTVKGRKSGIERTSPFMCVPDGARG